VSLQFVFVEKENSNELHEEIDLNQLNVRSSKVDSWNSA